MGAAMKSRSRSLCTACAKVPPTTMGGLLATSLSKQYVSIGFAFNQGAFRAWEAGHPLRKVRTFTISPARPGSFDAELSRIGHASFLLDLRRAPPEVRGWMNQGVRMRSVGSVFSPSGADAYIPFRLAMQFDGLIFVNVMHPTEPITRRRTTTSKGSAIQTSVVMKGTYDVGAI